MRIWNVPAVWFGARVASASKLRHIAAMPGGLAKAESVSGGLGATLPGDDADAGSASGLVLN